MKVEIKGFEGYFVTECNQIVKITQNAKGEKVKVVSPVKTHPDSDCLYIRLSRKENGKTIRYTFPLDEILVCVKSGVELGTAESKQALRKYRFENSLMGRVSQAVGNKEKEEELVTLLHATLVRQMKICGTNSDINDLTVRSVAQINYDFLKLCNESPEPVITVETKYGKIQQENPRFRAKLKVFDRLMNGYRALGLTFERVKRQIPNEILDGVSDIFEDKEKEEKSKRIGIVWNE